VFCNIIADFRTLAHVSHQFGIKAQLG